MYNEGCGGSYDTIPRMPLFGEVKYHEYTLIIVVLEHAKESNCDVNATPHMWMSLETP
jgi:hypothetical protein